MRCRLEANAAIEATAAQAIEWAPRAEILAVLRAVAEAEDGLRLPEILDDLGVRAALALLEYAGFVVTDGGGRYYVVNVLAAKAAAGALH
jgi:hypothetical protein